MIDKIKEIKSGFRKENPDYRALLALALTLPDICGRIEYPDLGVGSRYRLWFDAYVYKSFFEVKPPYGSDPQFQEVLETVKFDGDFCYALRCAYLHSGDLNVSPKANMVRCLRLFHTEVADGNRVLYYGLLPEETDPEKRYEIEISIKYLCKAIAKGALEFYYSKGSKAEELFAEHTVKIVPPRHIRTEPPQKTVEEYQDEGGQLVKGVWLKQNNRISLFLPEQYS